MGAVNWGGLEECGGSGAVRTEGLLVGLGAGEVALLEARERAVLTLELALQLVIDRVADNRLMDRACGKGNKITNY